MTRLVFLDTETTGLSLDDDVWEIAAIVRDPGVPDVEHHLFVDHSAAKCMQLPPRFFADHQSRFPSLNDPADGDVTSRESAAELVADWTDRAHIVGAVPNFDTERLALMLRSFGIEPGWHYHLICVEALAVGWIHGRYGTAEDAERRAVSLPWRSDDLAAACGIPPVAEADRHTAMGDARWVRDWYDAITAVTA